MRGRLLWCGLPVGLLSQGVGEQRVVAVPLTARVERHEQLAALLERVHDPGGVLAAAHGVAQWRGEALEDRRLRHERTRLGIEARQHLAGEIVDDVAVVARERVDERARVAGGAQRQRREVHRRRPSLGALPQALGVRVAERGSQRAGEEHTCFLFSEAQVGGAQLAELVARAQARERQWRVLA
jgi:hypothetical protein